MTIFMGKQTLVKKMNHNQKIVNEFLKKYSLKKTVPVRVLDLVSEVGELSKEVLNSTQYGNFSFSKNDDFAEELSDVYFSLIALAIETDVDLKSGLMNVLKKYENRIEAKKHPGSSK